MGSHLGSRLLQVVPTVLMVSVLVSVHDDAASNLSGSLDGDVGQAPQDLPGCHQARGRKFPVVVFYVR